MKAIERQAMIVVQNLSFAYKQPSLAVLDDVSFAQSSGTVMAVVGPSGCGKSTLLRCIAGLLEADDGSVSIGGRSPVELRRAKSIGFGFQDPTLLPWYTVRENIGLPTRLGIERIKDDSAVDEALSLTGLGDFQSYYPEALSGGMRTRVGLARALVLRPETLLLDEPLAGLDLLTRTRLMVEVGRMIRSRAASTIIVTHSLEEAFFWGDSVMVLTDRPARVLEVIGGLRPLPTEVEDTEKPEFISLVSRCRDLLFR